MAKKKSASEGQLQIVELDSWLAPYREDISLYVSAYQTVRRQLLGRGSILHFANGHHFYGFHKTEDGWVYREWAPGADALYLMGDFNNWDPQSHPLTRMPEGHWEIALKGRRALAHKQLVKVRVEKDGKSAQRIPLYIRRVVQNTENHSFSGQIWDPPKPFSWTDEKFRPAKAPPLIYECHIGMAQEKPAVGTYAQFAENVLPWIRECGYNTIQLMAIMQHPYYASFGYQVSNFFAPSSWFGTPEELKKLVNAAHEMGISVLLDLVHSHAAPNTEEGIGDFDLSGAQFFHAGARGHHPAWNSRLFDYKRHDVLHFLLSNVKYWMEEFHFDGFRFDGVTSMLYRDHGLGQAFHNYGQYFSMNTDVDALTYFRLANELVHKVKKSALTIAEDMSGMPGMCLPVSAGGLGFDYRLSMGVPDMWIQMLKDFRDEDWDMRRIWYELTTHRPLEPRVGYSESHDQALVGDKTLIFWLADKSMYTDMEKSVSNPVIDRAIALHKMIRFITLTLAGEGYLNFLGNEFGHPEWIDFPREGNGWSFQYARRQWSLKDNGHLKYEWLAAFDQAMLKFAQKSKVLCAQDAYSLWIDDTYKIIAYRKADHIFLFNFHPGYSLANFVLPVGEPGRYRVCLNTDEARFGGQERISMDTVYQAEELHGYGLSFSIYIPCRCALVLKKVGK